MTRTSKVVAASAMWEVGKVGEWEDERMRG
jgi:hypothetical protein